MSEQDADPLLAAVRVAAATIDEVRRRADEAAQEARRRRAEAIRACEAAGIPRDQIAAAAGVQWPVSRQRWSVLRRG